MSIIESHFKPSWWCRNKHLQTLYPTLFRKNVTLKLQENKFELPDGDFIELSWTKKKENRPIVIVLHGLEGSIDSPYAKGILKTIEDNGWQAVLMHFRGCGKNHNRLDRGYHSGDTKDLETFIHSLRDKNPNQKVAAIGFSLGGNVLLKYLGEKGKDSFLSAAIAVSVPFDLADGAKSLNKGFSKVYQKHLINRLSNKMHDKFRNKQAPFDIKKINKWKDFHSFDHNITAPVHGFRSADDYYNKSSSKQFLKNIETPTLILHSKDDPFMSPNSIPKESELSEYVTLELSEYGGHVGFIYGSMPFKEKYWIEKRLVDFLYNQFK